MSEKFKRAVEIVLEKEGGYVNHPSDPGGETKYGISKRSYPQLDIKNLTKEQASEIYYKDFWLPIKAESIEDERLSTHYFDMAVNSGKGRAIRTLEKVVGDRQTGIIFDSTINKANLYPDSTGKFVRERINFYTDLVSIKPSMKVFLKGWLNRVAFIEKKKGL